MTSPVALIIFNRPDLTQKVLAAIAEAKPSRLFVIADGPRATHPEDIEKCAAARSMIDAIDWQCRVEKNYASTNLGCGVRPATGISWVFEHTDRAIILEDDCLPRASFFPFCDELLTRYSADPTIMQICGNNYQMGATRTRSSYFFSRFNICAGAFATWRRAWQHYDMALMHWPELKVTGWLKDKVLDPRAVESWEQIFDEAHELKENADYWDYQWRFAFWKENGLAVMPARSLVTNLGFRPDATHIKNKNHPWANMPSHDMRFPLKHPRKIARNRRADSYFIEMMLESHKRNSRTDAGKGISGLVPRRFKKFLEHLYSNYHQISRSYRMER